MTEREGGRDLARWGIAASYVDQKGLTREVPGSTLEALLGALSAGRTETSDPAVWTRPGGTLDLDRGSALRIEDGGLREGPARIEVPAGYHHLIEDEAERLVVGAPHSCFAPEIDRAWGWAVQLYAVRSERSWGIGDLVDLRLLARDAADGGGCVLLNPLHAPPPSRPRETSPYYAGSRCFLDPIYLGIEELPGADGSSELAQLAEAGRALNDERAIDRDAVFALKSHALELLWARFEGSSSFDDFRSTRGRSLERFCTFTALSEVYPDDWRTWPDEIRRPDGPGITEFRRSHRSRIDFHAWVQWLLHQQALAAARTSNLIHDLAVGVAPTGADVWAWQDSFFTAASVGAPPDDYNLEGQDWAVVSFDPVALARDSYEPFIETLRSAMRYAAGVRIDHVMGMFRLFMIPEGATAKEGTYVQLRADRMLDLVALESQRARCYVIGEDLGTVEPIVRQSMKERSMLSYKLMWFEGENPDRFPVEAMAAINTHDLPTIAGLWTGADTAAEEAVGIDPNEDFKESIISGIIERLGVERSASVSEVIDRSYAALSTAPSKLVMGALEDVLESEERHNHPGTVGPWNWSTALPESLEVILAHPRKMRLQRSLMRERTLDDLS